MHENHGYDIVVLFHKRHGRGHTWDSFGTTGFSKDLLSKESKAGSSLKNIFRLGILNRMTQETNPDINPNTSTSTNNSTSTDTSTNTSTNTNTNSSTNTSANTNTNNANTNTSTSTHTRTNNTSTNTSSSTDTDNEVSTGLDSGSNTHSGKRIVLINEGNCVVVGWHCNSIG